MTDHKLPPEAFPTKDTEVHWQVGELFDGTYRLFGSWWWNGEIASIGLYIDRPMLERMSRAEAHQYIRTLAIYHGWRIDVEIPGRVIAAFLTIALGEPRLELPNWRNT